MGRVLRPVQGVNARGGVLPDDVVLTARRTVLDAQRAKAATLEMKFRAIGFVAMELKLASTRAVMLKAIESPQTLIGNSGIWWPAEAK